MVVQCKFLKRQVVRIASLGISSRDVNERDDVLVKDIEAITIMTMDIL